MIPWSTTWNWKHPSKFWGFSTALTSLHATRVHGAETTMIFLYRRPILDYWAENADSLGAIIRHVLIHEIGHHFGLSDEAMEAIEARD